MNRTVCVTILFLTLIRYLLLHNGLPNRRSQAQFACVACGYENHADVVGAINVLERGHRLLACGESAQLGRSVKQEPAEVRQVQV